MPDTELQVVDQNSITRQPTFAPQTFSEALKFADYLSKSSLIPTEFRGKPENILVAIQHGAELGLPPMQSLNCICVINGKPAIFGPSALAVVKAHPSFESIEESFDEVTMTATCKVKRRGEPVVVRTFSKEDAKRAGLWDERATISQRDGNGTRPNPAPWYCYPKRMLMFRARGFALNDSMPDALRGIVTAEEAQDYPAPTIEAQPVTPASILGPSQPAAQSVPQPVQEETVGAEGGTNFYKAYRSHGHTKEEAAKWLADNLKIGGEHNDKDSRSIPKSKFEEAMTWANSPAPIFTESLKLFEYLGFTDEEKKKFCDEQKWNFDAIVKGLKEELARRDAQEQ